MHTFFLVVPHATLQEMLPFRLVPLSDIEFRKEHGRFCPNRIFRVWNESTMRWQALWPIMFLLLTRSMHRISRVRQPELSSYGVGMVELGFKNFGGSHQLPPFLYGVASGQNCHVRQTTMKRNKRVIILSIIRVIKDGTWRSGIF